MERNGTQASTPHQLILQDRQQVEMTGVSDVDSFDETAIIAYTSLGELTIRGSDLRIKRLDLECGLLSVEGNVCRLEYANSRKKGGFLGSLLR